MLIFGTYENVYLISIWLCILSHFLIFCMFTNNNNDFRYLRSCKLFRLYCHKLKTLNYITKLIMFSHNCVITRNYIYYREKQLHAHGIFLVLIKCLFILNCRHVSSFWDSSVLKKKFKSGHIYMKNVLKRMKNKFSDFYF